MQIAVLPLFFFLCLGFSSASKSADLIPQPLNGPELFENYSDDAGYNISGAICLNGTDCLVIADELIAVQRIQLNKDLTAYTVGETFERIFSACIDPKQGNCPEWDLEAIARDGQRIFVTGSMGFKRKKVKFDDDRWVVAGFNVSPDGIPSIREPQTQNSHLWLSQLFSDHRPDISKYIDKPLQCGGLNIEGLARLNDNLIFGLRSPSDRANGISYLVEAPAKSILNGDDTLEAKLHAVPFTNTDGSAIANVGIRSLERIGARLIILTGDSGVGVSKKQKYQDRRVDQCSNLPGRGAHTNIPSEPSLQPQLWVWSANTKAPQIIGTIGGTFKRQKVEGIAIIARTANTADLLLTLDDPDGTSALAILRKVKIPSSQ